MLGVTLWVWEEYVGSATVVWEEYAGSALAGGSE